MKKLLIILLFVSCKSKEQQKCITHWGTFDKDIQEFEAKHPNAKLIENIALRTYQVNDTVFSFSSRGDSDRYYAAPDRFKNHTESGPPVLRNDSVMIWYDVSTGETGGYGVPAEEYIGDNNYINVYSDSVFGSGYGDTGVYFRRSFDDGVTWTKPLLKPTLDSIKLK